MRTDALGAPGTVPGASPGTDVRKSGRAPGVRRGRFPVHLPEPAYARGDSSQDLPQRPSPRLAQGVRMIMVTADWRLQASETFF